MDYVKLKNPGNKENTMDGIHLRRTAFTPGKFNEYEEYNENDICPVCNGRLGAREVSVTPCKHAYHSECLDRWIKQREKKHTAIYIASTANKQEKKTYCNTYNS